MDEGTLNDLLECSVCLERLDTSSRVLPCQHTFCRKCLDEIVGKHKELRCPECRILVNVKIDELPPNVLLMRILEGMRNALPKKQPQQQRIPRPTSQPHPTSRNIAVTPEHVVHKQQPQPLIHPHHHHQHHQPYAKALYDYESKEAGDLSFKRGDIIILRKRIDSHWYQGECGGRHGVFPLSYVQIITPVPSHIPQCKALYDFRMTNDDEEGCLVFNKGDIINVIRRVDENWAEGKLDGKIGIFPLTFVELNNLARSLMKLSTNFQSGPSRLAPPTPTTEDGTTPLIPTDHSRNIQSNTPLMTSDSSSTLSSGSSSTPTPNVSSSNTSSTSSTAPSSPASPPPRAPVVTARNSHPQQDRHNREKRHSFTGLTQSPHTNNTLRHSAEILATNGAQLPAAYTALYPYKPQKSDELELRKGGIYMVTERCQDGWYKGTSNRTQKCGVFPGNYVVLARGTASETAKLAGAAGATPATTTRNMKNGSSGLPPPPELPPRSGSPAISASWHGQESAEQIGRNNSTSTHANRGSTDKTKDKQKGTVSLMRRLASMKRSKSPPPSSTYSMDNPVFEDASVNLTPISHPVHIRSGSCPSQLLQIQSSDHHRLLISTSQRLKHKERPSVLAHNSRSEHHVSGSSNSSPDIRHHRKSNSLDAGNRNGKNNGTTTTSSSSSSQTVRERFRCIAPYPPNSEYELELQVDDIIYVHKKRDDGWYKGTQQRTGRTGLFPASFVENY